MCTGPQHTFLICIQSSLCACITSSWLFVDRQRSVVEDKKDLCTRHRCFEMLSGCALKLLVSKVNRLKSFKLSNCSGSILSPISSQLHPRAALIGTWGMTELNVKYLTVFSATILLSINTDLWKLYRLPNV